MTLPEILQLLDGVRGRGEKYMARCPCHDDSTQSLSICAGNDGRILLKCFAGCSTENIVAALGLTMSDLFADSIRENKTIVKTAEYVYAGGSVKKLKYRRPDGSKFCSWLHKEGDRWEKGRAGIEPGLYQSKPDLPESVFLVEGEKDVETRKALNLAAVSLPDGASSKWELEYDHVFLGKQVVILPDNDAPGQKYAQMCAERLHGNAASVKIVDLKREWPEIPPKADISDMVRHFGADAALQKVMEILSETPEWTPPPEEQKKKPGLSFITATELQTADLPPVQFLVSDILPVGTSLLSAASKIGKSWMVLDMGLSIAAGKPFMGHNTKQSGVLYLALEDSHARLQDRMNKVLHGGKAPDGMRFSIGAPSLDEGLLDILSEDINAHPETALIIVDTLQKIRGSAKTRESAYEQDYREMGAVKKFADERGISVMFVHHNRKMKDDTDPFNMISGTNGIMGAADTTWTIVKGKRSDSEATLHITGRDVEQTDTVISFDKTTWKWKPMGDLDLIVSQREREVYDSDPIVLTVKTLMKEAGEWSGSAAELMEEGKRICHRPIATSAQSVGYALKKLDSKLMDFDGIIHDRGKHGTAPGKHFFWFNDWTKEADLQEEMPM